MDGIDGLVIRRERSLGRITLDRPRQLNALTLPMLHGLIEVLTRWADDPQIGLIVLDGAGDKAFCGGCDLKPLYEASRENGHALARDFWRTQYSLAWKIATYPKPIVAIITGIVMDGGAGVAINARFRTVDEMATFAMPQTGLGLIPDAGASRFLSRMPGEAGTYLALTGHAIDASTMIAGGLADGLILRRDRARLLDALDEIADDGQDRFRAVGNALKACATPPGPASLADRRCIDQFFAGDRVETIIERLTEDGSDWARRTALAMQEKSPTSLVLALQALRRARLQQDLAATLKMEYRVATRLAETGDLYEGIRAAVIDRDRRPSWQPARLADVPDAAIDAFFRPLGAAELAL